MSDICSASPETHVGIVVVVTDIESGDVSVVGPFTNHESAAMYVAAAFATAPAGEMEGLELVAAHLHVPGVVLHPGIHDNLRRNAGNN